MGRSYAILLTAAALASLPLANKYIDHKVNSAIELKQNHDLYNLLNETQTVLENQILLETELYSQYDLDGRLALLRGSAYIVEHNDERYIITVAHNVSFSMYSDNKPLSPYNMYLELMNLDYKTTWDGISLEKIVFDNSRDVAVFKFPDETPEEFNMPKRNIILANSNELSVYEKVYVVGNPALSGTNIRQGIIGNDERRRNIGGVNTYGINVSANVYPGDSGTAVINSQGELIGLVKESHYNLTGYFAPINWFKEHMD